MSGVRLHDFCLDLCDHVVSQFRSQLRDLKRRPVYTAMHPAEWERLDFPAWFGRAVEALPRPLSDHLWSGVRDEPRRRMLTDTELSSLASAVNEPPSRLEPLIAWAPHPPLYRRWIECLREVREKLSDRTAEEWAADSSEFAARLATDAIGLPAGIETIQAWIRNAHWLLEAMDTPVDGCLVPGIVRDQRGDRRQKAVRTATRTEGNRQEPSPIGPDVLPLAILAKKLSISRSTLYEACRSGALAHYRVPARKPGRGKYLFRNSDVEAWLEALRVGGPAPAATGSRLSSSRSTEGCFSELNGARLTKAWGES